MIYRELSSVQRTDMCLLEVASSSSEPEELRYAWDYPLRPERLRGYKTIYHHRPVKALPKDISFYTL